MIKKIKAELEMDQLGKIMLALFLLIILIIIIAVISGKFSGQFIKLKSVFSLF